MTKEKIKEMVTYLRSKLDRRYVKGRYTQEQYHERIAWLNHWAEVENKSRDDEERGADRLRHQWK